MINNSFGKIYEKMFEGSLVGAGALAFAVMGYVIAKQRPVGAIGSQRMEVMLNARLLAPILGEKIEGVEKAIEFLCAPDPLSDTPDEGGRRLVKNTTFEYWVVNGMKYREGKKEEDRREQNRDSQTRFRAKKKVKKNSKPKQSLSWQKGTATEKAFCAAIEAGDEAKASQIVDSLSNPPTPENELPESL